MELKMKLKFEDKDIRIFEDEGRMFMSATDVCKAIGLRNAPQACRDISVFEKGVVVDNNRTMTVLTELGVVSVLMETYKPKAKDFIAWFYGTAIPAFYGEKGDVKLEDAVVQFKKMVREWALTTKSYQQMLKAIIDSLQEDEDYV